MGLRSRRTRAAEPATEVAADPTVDLTADLAPETELRVLRAQVRSLEQALAAVTDPAPAPPVSAPAPTVAAVAADAGDGLRRALLVARVVASRIAPDDDPRLAAARVTACLEQLSAEPGLARPLVAGEEMPVLEATSGELDEVVVDGPEVAEAAAVPVLAAVDTPEVVLPVPPPASPEPRRQRRRHRGSAA
ncbi:hypothetical protein [Nocardioides sp. YIM 152315]|uniref:hypothetical protein n=1 Tax=Nocardioides sp. YIM 152315 TaxID=3031760 RepID=UPI0023D9CC38|nr:hypothetical protein [Nocardioides sp. YIM 152315]MDF1603486.1 hypothetical protein [Nocardioides sp. YIM 152315]